MLARIIVVTVIVLDDDIVVGIIVLAVIMLDAIVLGAFELRFSRALLVISRQVAYSVVTPGVPGIAVPRAASLEDCAQKTGYFLCFSIALQYYCGLEQGKNTHGVNQRNRLVYC